MEINLAAEQFLNDYFYEPFKQKIEGGKYLELILSPQCNLKCSYCYLWPNADNLFEGCSYDKEKILSNLRLVMEWMEYNHFCPPVDIFSGEVFAQSLGYDALEIIYEYQSKIDPEYRIPSILIPTNMTFICSDELTARVDDFRDRFASIGIKFYLSASVDGKYIETNRSYDCNIDIDIDVVRDDAYYDKLFDYCIQHDILFHPMVYSRNIDKWKDNFLWFKENLEKRGTSVWGTYLLEVRNEEWTQSEIQQFQEFLAFLYDLLWEDSGKDPDIFIKHLNSAQENLNILGNFYWNSIFGLPCSIQGSLCVRLEDLAVPPCHRTSYPKFLYGKYVPDKEKVLTFKAQNVEMMATIMGMSVQSMPYCAECPINELCLGQCLGAQYESNKSLFVPIPTVCALEHAKLITALTKFEEYGVFNKILNVLTAYEIQQMQYLRREYIVKQD